ncbi:MAG TPA: iron-sulfur cluster repair di-iron protein [Terriglobales bacterium]|nr:iron-sulfur cluster repair di-iron protein [Terriglobales bacterium]
MTHTLEATRTVGELAVAVPGAARIFESMGIDFCCGGHRTLGAACASQGIEVNEILAALEFGQTLPEKTDEHWQSEPLPALIGHIVARHHQYVRSEVPHIQRWLDKTVAAHGERHPELLRIRHHFAAMATELSQHMAKEELILFPAIARLAGHAAPGATCFDSLAQPVRMMLLEHEHAGRDLAEMRQASGEFTPPPDACTTYRTLYRALAEFDADLRQHVHLENNILFPRALALEKDSAHAD